MVPRAHTGSCRLRPGWLSAGLVLMVAVGIGLLSARATGCAGRERVSMQLDAVLRDVRRAVGEQRWQSEGQPLLSDLERREAAAVDDAIAHVDAYFARARRGTVPFSEAVLGWQTRWYVLTSGAANLLAQLHRLKAWLQWRWLNRKVGALTEALDDQALPRHVASLLSRHVFSRSGLEDAVRGAVLRYQRVLAEHDAALRLAPAPGQPSRPGGAPVARSADDRRPVERLHRSVARDTLRQSRAGAHAALVRDLVQRLGTKALVALAAWALTEGAVELGLLSAATASAVWSLGVGVAVAALAHWALRAALNHFGGSPRRSIQRRLEAELAALHRCVVEGCTRRGAGSAAISIVGLRARLERHRAHRAPRLTAALRRLLGAEPG